MDETEFQYPDNSLFRMIEQNDLDQLQQIVEKEADLGIRHSLEDVVLDETLLHTAARLNRPECLKILFKTNSPSINIDALACYYSKLKQPQILTPLQIAVQNKHDECVETFYHYQQGKFLDLDKERFSSEKN